MEAMVDTYFEYLDEDEYLWIPEIHLMLWGYARRKLVDNLFASQRVVAPRPQLNLILQAQSEPKQQELRHKRHLL